MAVQVVYSGVLEWNDHRSFVYAIYDNDIDVGRIEIGLRKRGGHANRAVADRRLEYVLRGALADIDP